MPGEGRRRRKRDVGGRGLIHSGHLVDGEMAFRVKACLGRPSGHKVDATRAGRFTSPIDRRARRYRSHERSALSNFLANELNDVMNRIAAAIDHSLDRPEKCDDRAGRRRRSGRANNTIQETE